MEKLEDVLVQVEKLRRDLSAEIVVQEEEGHRFSLDELTGTGGSDAIWVRAEHAVGNWIVDKPEITKPDTQKQEPARQKLQQLYDISEWYSARYIAGRALGINEDTLFQQIQEWINGLFKKTRVRGRYEEIWEHTGGYAEGFDIYYGTEFVPNEKGSIEKFELEKIPGAREDLITLYKSSQTKDIRKMCGRLLDYPEAGFLIDEILIGSTLTALELRKIYDTTLIWKGCKEAKLKAGRALGHGTLRIWAHENPITATISGIAVGAASGLGYLIYQYLNK